MSRWEQNFQHHQFWKFFNDSIEAARALEADGANLELVQEVARLNKVLIYIDELLKGIDPELVPLSNWTNFESKTKECHGFLQQYLSSKDLNVLKQANASVDVLLTYVRPYCVADEHVAQSAKKAFDSYKSAIAGSISGLNRNVEVAQQEITRLTKRANEDFVSIKNALLKIKEYEEEVFGNSGVNGIKDELEDIYAELEDKRDMIRSFSSELFESEGIRNKSQSALQQILKDEQEVRTLLSNTKAQTGEYDSYYIKIFGGQNKEGATIKGLKVEIDERLNELDNFKKQQQDKYKTLIEQIDSLLPNATSAGLASAYYELKKSFNVPIIFNNIVFYVAIAALIYIAFITGTESTVDSTKSSLSNYSDFKSMLSAFAVKLPFMFPIIWLAVFVQRRRSEAQRLQQEYAHKEALAKSYESFKRQIDELEEEAEELKAKLLGAAIDAVSFNASATLEGKQHKQGTVLKEILGEVKELIEKK